MAKRRNEDLNAVSLGGLRLAPVILVRGSERALSDRVVSHLRLLARKSDPQVEVTDVLSSEYRPGQLELWASPSLFGDSRLILLDRMETAGDTLVRELGSYLKNPAADVTLVLRHGGGNGGRKVLDLLKKAHALQISCDPLKYDRDKVDLVLDESKRIGGQVTPQAASHIVSAAGKDLFEVLGTTRQLVSDTGGQVTEEDVKDFFEGHEEATAFEVADAVAEGQGPLALLLARRAFASGFDPVPMVAILASKMREIAVVTIPGAKFPGPPWRADRARKVARKWKPDVLGAAICSVARADVALKTGNGDAQGIVETCIIEISRLRAA